MQLVTDWRGVVRYIYENIYLDPPVIAWGKIAWIGNIAILLRLEDSKQLLVAELRSWEAKDL